MFTIYKLIDPETDIPFYIGYSKNKFKRFKQHVYNAKQDIPTNKQKSKKLLELLDLGFTYSTICITECKKETEQEAKKAEIETIARYGRMDKNEGPLLNLTKGGDGTAQCGADNPMFGKPSAFRGKTHTPAVKKILSDHQKKLWKNVTFDERFGENADKIRKALLKSRIGSHHSEETKQKLSEHFTGRTLSEETKQKISDSLYETPSNKKRYKLIDSNGIEYITEKGLASFCREHNLHLPAFKVLLNKGRHTPTRKNSKIYGWHIYKL